MSNRKRISFDKKLKILEECKKSVNLSVISQKYGIPKSSICTLKKNEHKIVENLKITNNGTKNRRSLKKGEFPRMEKALFDWFLNQRNKHIPVNGVILKAKALEIHNQIYGSDFHASDGWLSRFKNRYGIRLLKQTGEKLSARQDLVEPFKNHFHNLLSEENLTKDAIFNADETGLYWKLLPDKTFVHAGESRAPGRKLSKERVTVLLCANSSGSKKLKPLLIGKAKKSRSFKNRVFQQITPTQKMRG